MSETAEALPVEEQSVPQLEPKSKPSAEASKMVVVAGMSSVPGSSKSNDMSNQKNVCKCCQHEVFLVQIQCRHLCSRREIYG